MTAAEAQNLRAGDLVEFRGDLCTWIAKLVGKKKIPGRRRRLDCRAGPLPGGFGARLLKSPENFHLVGHSDYRV